VAKQLLKAEGDCIRRGIRVLRPLENLQLRNAAENLLALHRGELRPKAAEIQKHHLSGMISSETMVLFV